MLHGLDGRKRVRSVPCTTTDGTGAVTSERFNAAHYLLDRRVAAGDGDRVAVRCEGVDTTYEQLRDLAAAVAGGLRALDVRTGERVLLVASDRTELLAGLLAVMRLGAVATPVSTMLTGPELGKVLADSGARVMVVSPEYAEAATVAATHAPELAHVVAVAGADVTPPPGVQVVAWRTLATAEPLPVAPTTEDTPAL